MLPNHVRSTISKHLGLVLLPPVAARLEAELLYNHMPAPAAEGDVVADQLPEFFAFANAKLGARFGPHDARVLGRVGHAGDIRGVVVYSDLRRWSVEMSVASDGSGQWINRAFLRAAFAYPFEQLKVRRITARVEATNAAALELDRHLGFTVEGRQRSQFGDQDAVLLGMLASECRWLKEQR